MRWQLQDAKNKLSQVVKEALTTGPQIVTVHGEETAVVISMDEYRKLAKQTGSLVSFMQLSPWADVEIDLVRSKDQGREISL